MRLHARRRRGRRTLPQHQRRGAKGRCSYAIGASRYGIGPPVTCLARRVDGELQPPPFTRERGLPMYRNPLRTEYEKARDDAQEAWKALNDFRAEHGEEKIGKDANLF